MTRQKVQPLRLLLLTAAAALALSACGGGKPSGGPEGRNTPAPGAKGSKEAVDPKTINTPFAAIASGKVDIEGGLVEVAARAPGIVKDVLVQEGDEVKKDQVLARQEDEDSRLTRDRVAAQLKQTESQVPILEVQLGAATREEQRLKRLIAEKAAAQQAYDQAADTVRQLQAQLESQKQSVALSRAQLREANYQVDLHIVRAPTDGRIVRRYANPGSGASTFSVTALFQLQPAAARIVRAELEERSLSAVKVGQEAEIVPESDQDKSYPGKVLRIAEVMGSRKLKSDDPSERTDERVVEVVVDANNAPVLVGQRVLVKFRREGGAGPATPAAAVSDAKEARK
jgi:RND family efflux transporter MFP subunit